MVTLGPRISDPLDPEYFSRSGYVSVMGWFQPKKMQIPGSHFLCHFVRNIFLGLYNVQDRSVKIRKAKDNKKIFFLATDPDPSSIANFFSLNSGYSGRIPVASFFYLKYCQWEDSVTVPGGDPGPLSSDVTSTCGTSGSDRSPTSPAGQFISCVNLNW